MKLFSKWMSLTGLMLLAACAGHTPKKDLAATPADEMPTRVIDAHVHVHYRGGVDKSGGYPDTPEEFLRQLREVNGVGAVAHTSPKGNENDRDFKSLGIIPCFGISKDPDLKKVEAGLKNGFRCIKIYLGYEYQYPNHPHYKAVYRLAQKYNVPVVFHTGDTYDVNGNLKYSEPLGIDEVAVEFRKVKFVIAHIGNPWIETAAEVAYKNPNVYIDASALLIGKLSEYSAADLEEYVAKPLRWTWGYVEDPKKIMFGTDWPLVNIKDYLQVVKRAVPKEHWDRFFYQNAVDVFGQPPALPVAK